MANRQPPPPLDGVETALARREAAVAELRKAGHTRDLSADPVGRIFGLGFTLEQLHRNLLDLIDRANDIVPNARGNK